MDRFTLTTLLNLLVCSALLCCCVLIAQEPKHEIKVPSVPMPFPFPCPLP
jgi:hypothetical protein